MSEEYIKFGEPLKSNQYDELSIDAAKKIFCAIQAHQEFELVELKNLDEGGSFSEIVVVDCTNDGVPSKNDVGIKYRERLGLRFFKHPGKLPEVRALRSDFPATFHQNHVSSEEPPSLCIYFEPWSTIEYSWTAQKHLGRIQWWLEKMACGKLHAEDQPLEPFYFESRYTLILPTDFDEKVGKEGWSLIVEPRPLKDKDVRIFVGRFELEDDSVKKSNLTLSCEVLSLVSVTHGRVERIPNTLGELHDQFVARGVSLSDKLFEQIQAKAAGSGISKTEKDFTLLILHIPLTREKSSDKERIQHKGFLLHSHLGEAGVKGGVLIENQDKYWRAHLVGGSHNDMSEWREIVIEPIEIIDPFTRKSARRASGIASDGPIGVLAGVGALGSSIVNLWFREGWGNWTLIDKDILRPHNLARHSAFEFQIGFYKVNAITSLEKCIFPHEIQATPPIADNVNNFSNNDVCNALDSAELVVDVTATLEVPRDLSRLRSIKRLASVFITPSGEDSVLLLEDSMRNTTMEALEAQYYRAIITNPWGKNHLKGHQGRFWVGAGCRDTSTVIASDLVQLHGANLARQIRLQFQDTASRITIWHCDPESGTMKVDNMKSDALITLEFNGLTIIWNEGIQKKVQELRIQKLPNETGGILLGFFNLKLSRVYIVDALPAPKDSHGDQKGFTRGVSGLKKDVQTASKLTAGIVGYVGEWHGHPSGTTTYPSAQDTFLLKYLAAELYRDGLPSLMLIVGDEDERWILEEVKE